MNLFSPISVRSVTSRNRIVISPMQQYRAARDGKANNWHLAHLTKMAVGGAGIVFSEALAVEAQGRSTHCDLGIWTDAQAEGLRAIAHEIAAQGAVPGAQLFHAGRKASVQLPWDGYQSLGPADAARGQAPWEVVAPSPLAANPGWQIPTPLTGSDIRRLLDSFAMGARRVARAGFQALNVHGAHGYLIHTFLSPLSNQREDDYGGSLDGRMRFALEVAQAVRSEWPAHLPIFFRLSCIDDLPGGWTIEDTIVLSRELGRRGVDVIDCSSRGLGARGVLATAHQCEGFQVPHAEAVRAETGLPTMAVGLIRSAAFADAVVREGRADFVAIAREALFNPHWPLHAAIELGHDPRYESWPAPYGWWLARRARTAPAVK